MHVFKDSKGTEWSVEVNGGSVRRVEKMLNGLLLTAAFEDECKLLNDLAGNDPMKLVDVLYCICKPQADAAGITDEEFGSRMRGGYLLDGAKALLESLADFFPDPRKGAILRAFLDKADKVATSLTERILRIVDAMPLPAPVSGNCSGSSPAP